MRDTRRSVELHAYQAEIDSLRASLDEAVGLLAESTRWTRHDKGCPVSYSNICLCGLDNHRTARFVFKTRMEYRFKEADHA